MTNSLHKEKNTFLLQTFFNVYYKQPLFGIGNDLKLNFLFFGNYSQKYFF